MLLVIRKSVRVTSQLWGCCVGMELSVERVTKLRALVNSRDVSASIATPSRIVLWKAEGRRRKNIAVLAMTLAPTVDRWLVHDTEAGVIGLIDQRPSGPMSMCRRGPPHGS